MDAIEEIHKHGIIHRDIKPENIFLLDKIWVLGDFDIASFSDTDGVKLVKTKASDRLANYLFSAPEQSEKTFDEIMPSADWYAFGQILYWLIHEKTLRGQGVVSFNEHDESLSKYEKIVTKLLQHDPNKRPQSKIEIVALLNKSDKAYQERIYRAEKELSLNNFDEIIYKYMFNLGINGSGFQEFSDEKTITEIMSDLKEEQDTLDLWLSQGYADTSIKSIKSLSQHMCWLLDAHELKIKSIWIYKHFSSYGGSFLIIETDHMEPSGLNGTTGRIEEVGLYDNEHYVTRQEYDTGWSIINDTRIYILGKTDLRVRTLAPDIYFIAPKWGPLVENIKIFDCVYKEYCKTYSLNESILAPLNNIRRKPEVTLYD